MIIPMDLGAIFRQGHIQQPSMKIPENRVKSMKIPEDILKIREHR